LGGIKEEPTLNRMSCLTVNGAGFDPVNGIYHSQPHTSVPSKFDAVCRQQGWDTGEMWKKLNGRRDWYKHEDNESYIYYNCSDNKWWIDGPDGLGVYITSPTPPAPSGMSGPPENGWKLIKPTVVDRTLPTVKFPSTKGNLADFVEML